MKRYRVTDDKIKLKDFDPDETGAYKHKDRDEAERESQKLLEKLDSLQELLYAGGEKALLIVLQGMDTAGKDGTIKHVMSGVNPQGCVVRSFKAPTLVERRHDFLWRCHQAIPSFGNIGIFNRSYYEDILITRVHGEISDDVAADRLKEIRAFERLLTNNNVTVLKFFLNISKKEQRERLHARADNPKKRWKFNIDDLKERTYWKDYQKAYEEAIGGTSTKHAPWYVIPANHKWYRNLVVADTIVSTLEKMDLRLPPAPKNIHFKTLKIR